MTGSVMIEVVTAPTLDGCALCGIAAEIHGDRHGLAHLGKGRTTRYVAPSPDLIARRESRSNG